ncbi:MAG: TlpA disulfide reductase family protein [bacterium]|nr:TlpA disulfide reductase family protein [bacterium]
MKAGGANLFGIAAGLAVAFCLAVPAGAASKTGVARGEKAPPFTLRDLEGNAVSLGDHAGKVVLIVFSTTWCPHCRTEIPELNKLHAKFADRGLVILNVDVQESRAKVAAFAKKFGITYTVLLDADGATAKAYGVRGVPYNLLVGRDGTIICTRCAPLEKQVEKALSAGGGE